MSRRIIRGSHTFFSPPEFFEEWGRVSFTGWLLVGSRCKNILVLQMLLLIHYSPPFTEQIYSCIVCFSPPCFFSLAPWALLSMLLHDFWCFTLHSPFPFSALEKWLSHLHESKSPIGSSFSSFFREFSCSENVQDNACI